MLIGLHVATSQNVVKIIVIIVLKFLYRNLIQPKKVPKFVHLAVSRAK